LTFLLGSLPAATYAQQETPAPAPAVTTESSDGINSVDAELQNNYPKEVPAAVPTMPARPVVDYGELKNTAASEDVAVVQRNYMPKTGRFHLTGGLTVIPTDVFYTSYGLNARASYHFTETWGAELSAYMLSSTAGTDLKNLEDKQSFTVENLVTLNSYMSAGLYFSTIYGKIAWLNNRIIPFEIYQTAGIGTVATAESSNNPAFHAGIGDLFSIGRSTSFRIDLTWIFYQTENILNEKQNANNLLLTFAWGQFVPKVDYR
jgi:outer membrane beta-barrel protein